MAPAGIEARLGYPLTVGSGQGKAVSWQSSEVGVLVGGPSSYPVPVICLEGTVTSLLAFIVPAAAWPLQAIQWELRLWRKYPSPEGLWFCLT